MSHICPKCKKKSQLELRTWHDYPVIPFVCPYCYEFYWIECETKESIIITASTTKEASIPPIKEGAHVYIDNKEHEFFLERGKVEQRDHCHYRVRFSSLDKKINGKLLWVPEHWVKKVPEGL